MAKSETQTYVVTIGSTEYLAEEHTMLKAQALVLNAQCTARKATVADVIRIGSDNIMRPKSADGEA